MRAALERPPILERDIPVTIATHRRELEEPREPAPKRFKENHSSQLLPNVDQQFIRVPDDCRHSDQTSSFSVGAILAMRLVNFQVATDSTYRFGPYLNLVLGSNGTGKSTIVNAMFLLFRGKLSDLDRTNYDEFVQFGKPYAVVSAQLQGPPGKINPVIAFKIVPHKRVPGVRNSTPQWYINGIEANDHDIDHFINSMRIQVNNLCQFLPQFRVAAFSSESAQQRLLSTEHAIGYDGMAEDHSLLAETGAQAAELRKEVETLSAEVKVLGEKRDALLVRRGQLEQANEDKQKAEMMTQVIKLARYYDMEKKLKALRTDLQAAERRLNEFDDETHEKRDMILAEEGKLQSLRAERDELAANLSTNERTLRAHETSIRARREAASDCITRMNQLKLEMSTADTRIMSYTHEKQQIKLELGTLRKQLNEVGGDTAKFQEQQVECSLLEHKYKDWASKLQAADFERTQLSRRLKLQQETIRSGETALARLEKSSNLATRSPSSLGTSRYDGDAFARSVAFVESHQNKFEKPVIMPALLSLYVTDAHALPIFAEVVSFVHLQKFICQTRKDQETLTELASKVEDLDIKTTFVASSSSALQGFDDRAVASLKRMGFNGILSDKLDGPEPVLRFMNSLGLNRIPIALSELSPEVRENLRATSQGTLEFADSSAIYRVQRSKYGRRLPTETSRPLASSIPNWARLMVRKDTSSEQAALKNKIKTAGESVVASQAMLADLDAEIVAIRGQVGALTSDIKDLKGKIREEARLRERIDRGSAIEATLSKKLSELKALQAERSTRLATCINQLRAQLDSMSKSTLELPPSLLKEAQSAEYMLAQKSAEAENVQQQTKLLKEVFQRERLQLERNVSDKRTTLRDAEHSHRDLHESYEQATSWLRSCKMLKVGTEKAKFTPLKDLQEELNKLVATVDLHNQRAESLPSVLQQLEYAEHQLAEDGRKLELSSKRLEGITRDTSVIRDKWVKALKTMIDRTSAKFGDLFGKIGCRGTITLNAANDLTLGEWGIDINVAFRAGEASLSKLSKFRQSGGERAVSTALYLLALQEMTTAPFRVLDEINQGMDEKNEHTTMKFFVDLACEPIQGKAQQSFLVTPKLISNMPCHKNMSVTFIFGGTAVANTRQLKFQEKVADLLEEEVESENENDDENDSE